MKIKLKEGYLAVLTEESGEIVGVFGSNEDAKSVLEDAVSSHFDRTAGLCDGRDFSQPFDYQEPYAFMLYGKTKEEDEHVTLTMTYAPMYRG